MSKNSPQIIKGARSWQWYANYITHPFHFFNRVHKTHGKVFVLGNPFPSSRSKKINIIAFGEDVNRAVFSQTDLFRPGGQFLRGPKNSAHQRLRGGLLAMRCPKARHHRKMIQPPFAKPAVASYVPTIKKLIDQVFDRWVIGEPLDMHKEMTTLANWIAAHILFGHEDFEQSMHICKLIIRWIDLDVMARRYPMPSFIPGAPYPRMLRHAEAVERAIHDLINAKRREAEPTNDVMSYLVHATKNENSKMDDIDLAAHTVILHAAAFITTANALAWTTYLLAQNPKFAAKLNEEVKTNITNWPPDPDQVDKLPLVDGLVREALRLFPPVHHTMRTATADTELLGIPMRSGDRVLLSSYITHRDPSIFENPNTFDPERWLRNKPNPFQYTPFSAGPRLCLGYQFALTEMKMIVVRLMQRFRLNVIPNSRIEANYNLILQPKYGIPMVVSEPDGAYSSSPVKGNINEILQCE